MKLITACSHLDADLEELKDKFGSPSDEGRFFLITELCKDCAVERLMLTGVMHPNTPVVHLKDEPIEERSTLGSMIAKAHGEETNEPREDFTGFRGIVSEDSV